MQMDVRFWHKADIEPLMFAFGGKADMGLTSLNVRS
jgi:hypothetical protein